jgi:hypothetical protein
MKTMGFGPMEKIVILLFVKQQLETTRDIIPTSGIPKWNTVNNGIIYNEIIYEYSMG